jgi:hypothetical protein
LNLTIKISESESLFFYGDEINHRHDLFIKINCPLKDVHTLFFFDSRGISMDYEQSLIKLIISEIDDSTNYLIIGRPLEMTTWMSLYNFIRMNSLFPERIITNMGFVDFTPKKKSLIKKSVDQSNLFFSNQKSIVNFIELFESRKGELLELYDQDYHIGFVDALYDLLVCSQVIIINTPLLYEGYQFMQKRPMSFAKGVIKGNEFNSVFKDIAKIVEFDNFSEKQTYDGVHYTEDGNNTIFSKLKPYLI